jgi:hypothetical protein
MFKFQVQFLLFPVYNMTRALSSVHPLIPFCLDDAHDSLGDAWRTTWHLHLVSRLLCYLFLFTKFRLLFYLFSIGTDPWKIFSYRLVFLQVSDFNNKCLDISLTGMNGEWRGIQVS